MQIERSIFFWFLCQPNVVLTKQLTMLRVHLLSSQFSCLSVCLNCKKKRIFIFKMTLDFSFGLEVFRENIFQPFQFLFLSFIDFCFFRVVLICVDDRLCEMMDRLPGILRGGVAFPFDPVKQLAIDYPLVDHILDLVPGTHLVNNWRESKGINSNWILKWLLPLIYGNKFMAISYSFGGRGVHHTCPAVFAGALMLRSFALVEQLLFSCRTASAYSCLHAVISSSQLRTYSRLSPIFEPNSPINKINPIAFDVVVTSGI